MKKNINEIIKMKRILNKTYSIILAIILIFSSLAVLSVTYAKDDGLDRGNDIKNVSIIFDDKTIRPNAGEILYGTFSFELDEVKRGDYVEVSLSDNIDFFGINDIKEFTMPVMNGKVKIADAYYSNRKIKYVFTADAEDVNDIVIKSENELIFIDRNVVRNSQTISSYLKVGSVQKDADIQVYYKPKSVSHGEINGDSLIIGENSKEKTLTNITYINTHKERFTNVEYKEKNSKNNYAKFDDTTEVKIYKLKDGSKYAESLFMDLNDYEDVTSLYNIKLANNELNIDFGEISTVFAIVTKEHYEVTSGNDAKIELQSYVKGLNKDYYKNTSSTMYRDFMAESSDLSAEFTKYEIAFAKKITDTDTFLTDAKLQLIKGESTENITEDNIIRKWKSIDKSVEVEGLKRGIYTLMETEAPVGYKIANPITFRITNTGNVEIKEGDSWSTVSGTSITMFDSPIKVNVRFIKKAISSTGEMLSGAKLQIENSEGAVVQEWETTGVEKAFELGVGDYKLVEKSAPKGYNLANPISFTVGSDGKIKVGKVELKADEPIIMVDSKIPTIEFNVTKEWIGNPAKEVKINLLADKIKKETITLNEKSGWIYTFKELPKYDSKDGHKIEYTVEEVKIDGYISDVTGNVEKGFTITNTITGKVDIPVEKKWIGKAGNSATIELYADNTKIKEITLTETNHWKHTFDNLDKYKAGKEINYRVKEVAQEGYDTKVVGDIKSGFIVTNTNIETTKVSVEKKWVGKTTESVEVKLFADGVEKETATLNAQGGWKYIFRDLAKYDTKDGHKINYTIEEAKVDGYISRMIGDATKGFIVTNTITGKVSVSVAKKWIGKEGSSATIHLMADGEKKETVVLNTGNKWQHTFENLEQYKNGREIKYSVEEENSDGYETSISGNAKDGYLVTNRKIITKITASKGITPKTGYSSNIALYSLILSVSGGALVLMSLMERKLKN